MVNTPDVLTELLAKFRSIFDRRQFRQFSRYIASSWASPTRSVAQQSNGTYFVNRKRPGNDKIEYDAAYGLYKEGEGNNGNAPN